MNPMNTKQEEPTRRTSWEIFQALEREGWRVIYQANVLISPKDTLVSVVLPDGRHFQGTQVEGPKP